METQANPLIRSGCRVRQPAVRDMVLFVVAKSIMRSDGLHPWHGLVIGYVDAVGICAGLAGYSYSNLGLVMTQTAAREVTS